MRNIKKRAKRSVKALIKKFMYAFLKGELKKFFTLGVGDGGNGKLSFEML